MCSFISTGFRTIIKNQIWHRRDFVLAQYVSGNNWLASWNEQADLKNLDKSSITDFYAIPPELKINSRLQTISPDEQTPDDLVAISYFAGMDPALVRQELKNAGALIVQTKFKPANIVFIRNGISVLKKIAALPFVASINPQRIKDMPLNNNNRAIHGVQALAAGLGRNLDGKGVIVGIGDNADPSTHVDFTGRLIMRTDEPVDYHGTHTSGTLAGGGILNPLYRGMAPKATLIVNDFSNILVNTAVYSADFNMVLSNNSYYNGLAGCPGEADYDALSNYVDSVLIAFPKVLHVFAAGNDGGITCSPFPAAFGNIKTGFQTAKNVLTVGRINNSNYEYMPAPAGVLLLTGESNPKWLRAPSISCPRSHTTATDIHPAPVWLHPPPPVYWPFFMKDTGNCMAGPIRMLP